MRLINLVDTLLRGAVSGAAGGALLLLAQTAAAAPVTIDFDAQPTFFGLSSHAEDGFTLTSDQPDGTLIDNNNLVRGGIGAPGIGSDSLSLFWGANGATSSVTLVNDLSLPFDLLSFEASSLYNPAGTLTLAGTLAGWGAVNMMLTLSSDLESYSVPGLTGLTALTFQYDGASFAAPYDLDNIRVNVVPLPGAVWLLGSALLLLGRRLQRR
ncbi:MAG: hypothetical protein V2J12_04730 [Gammaproteobacteria bacterium]|jgi:hypothetical protein|nr:hypothetical protein [Gammaproteobacteria bacterium]